MSDAFLVAIANAVRYADGLKSQEPNPEIKVKTGGR
jgi:hypothetical protein